MHTETVFPPDLALRHKYLRNSDGLFLSSNHHHPPSPSPTLSFLFASFAARLFFFLESFIPFGVDWVIFSSPDWFSASSSLIGSKFFEWNEGEGRAGELRLKHVTQSEPRKEPSNSLSFLFFTFFGKPFFLFPPFSWLGGRRLRDKLVVTKTITNEQNCETFLTHDNMPLFLENDCNFVDIYKTKHKAQLK